MSLAKHIAICALFGLGTSPSGRAAADTQIAVSPNKNVSLDATPYVSGSADISMGTSVTLRLKEAVTSRTSKRGDFFTFELVNDIRNGSVVAIPAGTLGVGQVVHSAPKGFGGKAGELIIAARYLETSSGRLALRKTKLSVAGSDNVGAAVAASLVSPVIGIFVTGTSVDLAAGSIIVAETGENFQSASTVKKEP